MSRLRKQFEVSLSAHPGSPSVVLYDEHRNLIPLWDDDRTLVSVLEVNEMIAFGVAMNPPVKLKHSSEL